MIHRRPYRVRRGRSFGVPQDAKLTCMWISDQQQAFHSTADDVQRELTRLRDQQDRLLNLRLLDEIEAETFARKNTELRDRIAALTLQLESAHRGRDDARAWRSECLNSRNVLRSVGLRQSTPRNVQSWKLSV